MEMSAPPQEGGWTCEAVEVETLKSVLWNILKYLLLVSGLAVLTGYLAVKDRLPAVVPEEAAVWLKEKTLALLSSWSGKAEKPIPPQGRPQGGKETPRQEGIPWMYRVLDWMLLDGRGGRMEAVAEMNRWKAAESLAEAERMVAALAASEFAKEFFSRTGGPEGEIGLRSYLDKFVQESPTVHGYEVFDASGRPIPPGKYEFTLPLPAETVPPSSGWKVVYAAVGTGFWALDREVVVRGERLGFLRLIYGPAYWAFVSLPEGIPGGVVVRDDMGKVVHRTGEVEALGNEVFGKGFGKVKDGSGRLWRVFERPLAGRLVAVYGYRTVPGWKAGLNGALVVTVLALAFLLVRLVVGLFGWVRRQGPDGAGEEVLAATMAEMVKTLKSTADLAARMKEGTREELEALRKAMESGRGPAAAADAGKSGGDRPEREDGGWEVM